MSDAHAVVWMESAEPSADASRALESWARARGVRLRAPSTARAREIPVDLTIGEVIERELERARDTLAALDVEGTEHALARAELLVREHPELPQAAWLRAEVERGWAARWLRGEPRDPERAERAWQRAAALDGGRAPGIGESPLGTGAPRAKLGEISIDSDPDLEAWVDGLPALAADRTSLPRGEGDHQVVLAQPSGAVVWAAWVTLATGSKALVHVPRPAPCSLEDITAARLARLSVLCPAWVAARSEGGGVSVAVCERGQCGPSLAWTNLTEKVFATLPETRDEKSRWPKWATWATVGVGAALATTLTLYAAGAFDAPPHQTRFVNGGVR